MTKDAVDKAKLFVTTKDRTLAENKDQYQLFIDKFNKSQKVHPLFYPIGNCSVRSDGKYCIGD